MKVLLVYEGLVPVKYYGGTPRVIWHLGKELVDMGHEVTYLVHKGSTCSFGSVISIDEDKAIVDQIPDHIDIVHFQWTPPGLEKMTKPYVVTIHSNSYIGKPQDKNTIFVSKNHASRYGSTSYVTNGIDWSEYMPPDFSKKQDYFHFLGKAAWRVKNIQGAIDTIKKTKKERLKVLGGHRLNFKMGFRFTLSSRVSFHGMVGGKEKYQLLNNSKGLIFPVRWHEPMGLAIVESLFYGCPVFATPYGAISDFISKDVGFLSNKSYELAEAVEDAGKYSQKYCHEYAVENFNSRIMAEKYLEKYERVLAGEQLNQDYPMLPPENAGKTLEWFK